MRTWHYKIYDMAAGLELVKLRAHVFAVSACTSPDRMGSVRDQA